MPGFFTSPTESLHYSGKDISTIKNGDDLNTVIEKLVSEIDRLNNVISSSSTSSDKKDQSISTDNLKSSNSFGAGPSFKDSSYSAKIVVAPKSNSVEVAYDLNDIGSGDKIFSRVTVDGIRNGAQSVILDSDKMSSGFILSPDNFPATMYIELRRRGDNGETKVYNGSIPLSLNTKSGDYPVFSKEMNKSNLENQTQVNDFLYQQIVSLQKTVSNSSSVDGGTKTVNEAVSEIKNEIYDLKKQDISKTQIIYKNGEGNVTKTLQEIINDLVAAVNSLK